MPTAPLSNSRLIVHERTGDWAVAWKRRLGGSGVVVCQSRTGSQWREQLAQWPASIVALELTAENLPALLAAIVSQGRAFPHGRFLVLAARGDEPSEGLLREAGAVHVVFSPAELEPAVRIARRHVERAPRPQLSLREAIWSRLPWANGLASA